MIQLGLTYQKKMLSSLIANTLSSIKNGYMAKNKKFYKYFLYMAIILIFNENNTYYSEEKKNYYAVISNIICDVLDKFDTEEEKEEHKNQGSDLCVRAFQLFSENERKPAIWGYIDGNLLKIWKKINLKNIKKYDDYEYDDDIAQAFNIRKKQKDYITLQKSGIEIYIGDYIYTEFLLFYDYHNEPFIMDYLKIPLFSDEYGGISREKLQEIKKELKAYIAQDPAILNKFIFVELPESIEIYRRLSWIRIVKDNDLDDYGNSSKDYKNLINLMDLIKESKELKSFFDENYKYYQDGIDRFNGD